jgi:hypothetical protein
MHDMKTLIQHAIALNREYRTRHFIHGLYGETDVRRMTRTVRIEVSPVVLYAKGAVSELAEKYDLVISEKIPTSAIKCEICYVIHPALTSRSLDDVWRLVDADTYVLVK